MEHMSDIKDISVVAGKEYALHTALEAMKAEWGPLRFTCVPYKNTDTHIITGVDEVLALLDDQLVKVQGEVADAPNEGGIELTMQVAQVKN